MAKRIYVGNLPWSISSSDLQEMFGQYGEVTTAEVVMDRVTGRSRGFGFVEMTADDAGTAAIEALNGKDFGGRASWPMKLANERLAKIEVAFPAQVAHDATTK